MPGDGWFSIKRETIMSTRDQGQNDAQQNKGMSNDPTWTDTQRDEYQAAYNNEKRKQQDKNNQN